MLLHYFDKNISPRHVEKIFHMQCIIGTLNAIVKPYTFERTYIMQKYLRIMDLNFFVVCVLVWLFLCIIQSFHILTFIRQAIPRKLV
jgi:hypothetical protein